VPTPEAATATATPATATPATAAAGTATPATATLAAAAAGTGTPGAAAPGTASSGAAAPGAAAPGAAAPGAATGAAGPGAAGPGAAAPAGREDGIEPGFADALAARRRSVRAAVNRAMERSAAVPQFTVFADLDLEALRAARGRVGWTTLLVRALALTLRDAPNLNGDHEHVGVALAADTPVGLLAPVVRDPDRMPAAELDAVIRATVEKARNGRLSAADLAGATVTVSNLGGWQVQSFQALLTPPQAAVLSVGAIEQRPAVGPDGGLTVRTTCTVGLTVDHRAADGADAARLLAAMKRLVCDPRSLLS
jgi:pyruvate dehydrogenase E2 component (dihydrolipoamide acetyltransferase)